MITSKYKLIAALAMGLAYSGIATAQSTDNQALINALIKKGVLTEKEAKEISAEVAKDQSAQDVEQGGFS